MTSYDLIVIGAGPGGYETAARAAAKGMRTLIIERDQPGGTCLNRGCIPTKALCRSAEVALMMKGAAVYGVNPAQVTLDWAQAMRRKDDVVTALREGVAAVLSGVDVELGEARFTEPSVVEVGGRLFTAPRIIVATGSRPASLPIPGAGHCIDSDRLLEMESLPETMVIIGGGVIGMEFASILNAFGVGVTVIEYCPEILPGFDTDIAKRLRMAMKRRGVAIVTGARALAVEPGCRVIYETKGKEKTAEADAVLMAVGRRPVIPPGLEELGVALTGRGAVKVDPVTMLTSVPGIYAVGDVNGLCMLAHAATAQGMAAIGEPQRLDVVPAVVFSEPECAMVGLTEEACRRLGMPYLKGEIIYRANGKAMAAGQTDGVVKVLVDAASHAILGCHACGAHAGDLVQEAALAITGEVTADTLCATIHSHPSLSELLKAAVQKAIG